MGLTLAADGAAEIAGRARGTPRVAGRLLRRVRDFAAADGTAVIDKACAARGLARLEVDAAGLDSLDRRYLSALIANYGGRPAGGAAPPPPHPPTPRPPPAPPPPPPPPPPLHPPTP